MKYSDVLPCVELSGVSEHTGYQGACSLVFHLQDADDNRYQLTLAGLLDALKFAEQQQIIPAFSPFWWARVGDRDGCVFQEESG